MTAVTMYMCVRVCVYVPVTAQVILKRKIPSENLKVPTSKIILHIVDEVYK